MVISAGGLLRGEIDGLCGSWNGDDSDDQNIEDLLNNMTGGDDDDDDDDEDGFEKLLVYKTNTQIVNHCVFKFA